jgi:hypothetical protein
MTVVEVSVAQPHGVGSRASAAVTDGVVAVRGDAVNQQT